MRVESIEKKFLINQTVRL